MRFVRKNAAPPTAEAMRAEVAAAQHRIAELTAERSDINAALPDLIGEPAVRREAEDRLALIDAELHRERRTASLIEDAISEAEKRERIAAYEANKADLERRTRKLERTLEPRHKAAAEALGAILREMEENDREWDRISSVGRELGVQVPGGWDAEFRVRRELPGVTHAGFASLWRGALVEGWSGDPVYRGPSHRYTRG